MILRSWQGNYGALELCTLPGVDGGGAKGLFQKSHAGLPNPLDNLILSYPSNVRHISIHIHQTFHKSREKHHTVQCFAPRLPHDGFANVGGNEQGNTRAEAVALADSSDSSVCFITKKKTWGNLWVEALGHQHVKSSWSSSKPKTTNLRLPCLTYSISVPSATAHLTCSETGDLKCCQLPFGTRRCSKNVLHHSQAASPCIPNKSASDGSRNTGLRDTRMVSLTLRLKNIQFTFWANFNHSTNEIIVRKGINLSILHVWKTSSSFDFMMTSPSLCLATAATGNLWKVRWCLHSTSDGKTIRLPGPEQNRYDSSKEKLPQPNFLGNACGGWGSCHWIGTHVGPSIWTCDMVTCWSGGMSCKDFLWTSLVPNQH